jgi:UDP-N-acetylglucosamine--N-acetylmuramyl-(pentapeptide) pyrophosphoryl-undecaprenol N-acetylglucosamine transferase
MRILFSGGGTAGSVSPLIAIYRSILKQQPDTAALFIGTRQGNPERKMVEPAGITYRSIFSGKLRRYFDLRNLLDPFLIIAGFIQSFFIISKFDPDVIIGAGGFVSVPVIWAGWVMQKKIIIHQQDIKPSLSNILTMNLANIITTTFEESKRFFPEKKVHWIGNPSRIEQYDFNDRIKFTIDQSRPLVVFVGGGTGSEYINSFVKHNIIGLVAKYQIIHISGSNKENETANKDHYHQFSFLGDELMAIFQKADVIISRAGLSTLTELSYLSKPSIIIPLPKSHQVQNAEYFLKRDAIGYHDQLVDCDQHLLQLIDTIISNQSKREILSRNISSIMKKNACSDMIKLVNSLVNYGPDKSA